MSFFVSEVHYHALVVSALALCPLTLLSGGIDIASSVVSAWNGSKEGTFSDHCNVFGMWCVWRRIIAKVESS